MQQFRYLGSAIWNSEICPPKAKESITKQENIV